jgi:predicted nucleic acid-binding Zn ribbon protein
MPEYTFECQTCAKQVVLFFTMSDYDKKNKTVKCPSCQRFLVRNFLADNVRGFVTSSLSDCKTIGQYAEKQTAQYSKQQVEDIVDNFKTKKVGGMKKLPTGMSRIEQSKNPTKWTQD